MNQSKALFFKGPQVLSEGKRTKTRDTTERIVTWPVTLIEWGTHTRAQFHSPMPLSITVRPNSNPGTMLGKFSHSFSY